MAAPMGKSDNWADINSSLDGWFQYPVLALFRQKVDSSNQSKLAVAGKGNNP
jgi:hypothetical protein